MNRFESAGTPDVFDELDSPDYASEIAESLAVGFSQNYMDWITDGGLSRATLEQVENPGPYFSALRRLEVDPAEFSKSLTL